MNFTPQIFRNQELREIIIALMILVIMRLERKLFIHPFKNLTGHAHVESLLYSRKIIIGHRGPVMNRIHMGPVPLEIKI